MVGVSVTPLAVVATILPSSLVAIAVQLDLSTGKSPYLAPSINSALSSVREMLKLTEPKSALLGAVTTRRVPKPLTASSATE